MTYREWSIDLEARAQLSLPAPDDHANPLLKHQLDLDDVRYLESLDRAFRNG